MQTIRKIDYFGGLHGHFLELAVNHSIDQNSYDISGPQFTNNGACHVKRGDKSYKAITVANHYSYYRMPFHADDLVIRIVPTESDLLCAITNSFKRAGDQSLDLDNLEHDTYNKLSKLPKFDGLITTLLEKYGNQKNVSRCQLRKLFYAMFEDKIHGLDMMTNWQETQHYHEFPFRSLFDIDNFFESLQGVARFVNMEFLPTKHLVQLHKNFLELNQGFHSEIKCKNILKSIIMGEDKFFTANILEEAWINYKISKDFNLYDIPELEIDQYPKNTAAISRLCFTNKLC